MESTSTNQTPAQESTPSQVQEVAKPETVEEIKVVEQQATQEGEAAAPSETPKAEIPKEGEKKIYQPRGKRERPVLPKIQEQIIKDGDFVVAFFDPQNQMLLKIKKDTNFDAKFGHFRHNSIIGQKFASKIWSMNQRNYMYVLKPNKTKFTDTMLQRTQILYHMDISSVIGFLDIKPGMTIVETGTGSGSLSFAISQHLGSTGRLFTFEFNKERHEKAIQDMEMLGASNISLFHRNAYTDGFLVEDQLAEGQADAVFLDLPSPWHAVEHATTILKKGGRICNFSPCIEQVQKTIIALGKKGFCDFHTIEALQRPFHKKLTKENSIYSLSKQSTDGQKGEVDNRGEQALVFEFSNGVGSGKWHTGYLTFATKFL